MSRLTGPARLLAASLLSHALAGSPSAQSQEEEPPPPAEAPPTAPAPTAESQAAAEPEMPRVVAPARTEPLSRSARDESLAALVTQYPRWVTRPAGAADDPETTLSLLVLGDRTEGAPSRPALFFGGGAPGTQADELALALAWELAAEAEAGGPAAALLARSTLLLAFGTNEGADRTAVPLDADFPAGWSPVRLGGRGGLVPLERPQTRGCLRLLAARRDLALALRLRRPGSQRGSAWPGAAFPGEDEATLARIARAESDAGFDWLPWPSGGPGGGGLLDWTYQAEGVLSLALTQPRSVQPGEALATWIGQGTEGLRRLAEALPRLVLADAVVTRLGPELWQLDLAATNAGRLPTSSALAAARGAGGLALEVAGARLVALAGALGDESFRPRPVEPAAADGPGRAPLPERLAAGATYRLRLVLAAPEDSEVRLALRLPWGTAAELTVPLRPN